MIHYHGTPISGGPTAQMAYSHRHAMISYASQTYMEQIVELVQSFALDNGAFSAWKSGTPFDLPGYAQWLGRWHRHPAFDWCLCPDVIDGSEETNADMAQQWRDSVSDDIWNDTVHVWHLHESLDKLDRLVSEEARVAIGSSGQYAKLQTPQWWARMDEAWMIICDDERRPRARIHGLRMLDPTVFSRFPLSSGDSTSAAYNAGMDTNWGGPYAPPTPFSRALCIMERIETHAAAARLPVGVGIKNLELFA